MILKSEIKLIRSLSIKKHRDELSLFVVEGDKLVEEAVNSDFEVVSIFYRDKIGDKVMSQISALSSPPPSLAIVKQKRNTSVPILENDKLYLALDGIKDPGNLGTIIRIADWFGIDAIFASDDSVDMYNNKVVQASMGAVLRKCIHYTPLESLLKGAQNKQTIYGTFIDGLDIYSQDLAPSGIIVMGSESHGISSDIEKLVNKKLLIPPYPRESQSSESLNVAIATAIICAEFRRCVV